ncbi:MAG: hypothetical protein QM730_19740 [Anaerolineales bacterium]
MLSACASQKNISLPLALAAFNENDVDVSIQLDQNSNGETILSATFTPLAGNHMYSKDIPITGVDGLGRPTLIELTADSQMKITGKLMENIPAEVPNFEPKTLLVYPPGAVTLSLPVELPSGNDWVEDVVKITYMSCSDTGCKPPVIGKLITVRVPGADMPIKGDNNE